MDTKEVTSLFKDILEDKLGVSKSEIEMSASLLDDLGADSLDMAVIIMSTEMDFGIEISDNEAMTLKTVEDCVNKIAEKLA